ncbi:tRNA-splicing endonuclease subunit Sen2 [Chanos chanos]|uniref:tRNA-splicing endonuclease subunit Sen2 n=1 Tax=Chanos chanos TaxID=29144 RepID=A0A6J2VNC9_CHACN|nr:tRNA-splicing endonuclease subunit Sen2 [Chanos chanos]
MAEAVFQAPKRRAKIYESYEAPLPVPFLKEQTSLHQGRPVFKAELVNQYVIVRDPYDIQALYGKGYFGKGVLSRSRPNHSISERWEKIGGQYLPVIPLSKYQEHVSWARSALLAQGLEKEAVDHALQNLTHPVELDFDTAMEDEEEHDEDQVNSHQKQRLRSPRGSASDGLCLDQSMDDEYGDRDGSDGGLDIDCVKAEEVRRQGDPRYDPLAELYPQEPEKVDESALGKVKCKRHDDWILHCGCRLDESQMITVMPKKTGPEERDQSVGHEYVLVEEYGEEDNGESEQNNFTNTDRMGHLVCRINPFRMLEYLQLSLEEAFFLVYALGCLSIHHSGEPLFISEVWKLFCSVQANFESTYVVYHYFRSKGWVPKSGIKYGTDFILYRKGPPFYHASYSVVVERVDDSLRGALLRPFSWRSLAALCRITGNVSKELMLCYVIVPSDMTTEAMSSPECLKRIKVQELIMSRWISSRERSEQDEI